MIALIGYPGHLSIEERLWSQEELPNTFSEISKKYMTNNNIIVLNNKYKTKLADQYIKLRDDYGWKEAKKKIIPIISYVLENELPKSGENIDTMMLFDKIQKIISDSLKSNNSGG